jgi:hypothetical protein
MLEAEAAVAACGTACGALMFAELCGCTGVLAAPVESVVGLCAPADVISRQSKALTAPPAALPPSRWLNHPLPATAAVPLKFAERLFGFNCDSFISVQT